MALSERYLNKETKIKISQREPSIVKHRYSRISFNIEIRDVGHLSGAIELGFYKITKKREVNVWLGVVSPVTGPIRMGICRNALLGGL